MPRRIRFIYPQLPHHAIQRGNNKQVIFPAKEDKKEFLGFLRKYSGEFDVSIGAYCIMDNHFHLLLYPESEDGMIRFMKTLNQVYTQYFNHKYGRTGKLWENRYKLNIVDPEYEWVISRYIDDNPVRAKIVNSADKYDYSSAKAHLNGENGVVCSKDIVKGKINEYREFMGEPVFKMKQETNRIGKVIQKGIVMGGSEFIKRMEKNFRTSLIIRNRGRQKKDA